MIALLSMTARRRSVLNRMLGRADAWTDLDLIPLNITEVENPSVTAGKGVAVVIPMVRRRSSVPACSCGEPAEYTVRLAGSMTRMCGGCRPLDALAVVDGGAR